MKNYLKTYEITLKTIGPVFVGSGQEVTKKEYIYMRKNKKVIIPDISKMYQGLAKLCRKNQFEDYFLKGARIDLAQWLENERIPEKYYDEWKAYSLDCGDAILEGKKMQIMSCVKDPYGLPYIPGSSLKGMLRTIFLSNDILTNSSRYDMVRRNINVKIDERKNRNVYLRNESKTVEAEFFNQLNRPKSKKGDMVNDIMSGVIVGDSEPLSTDDLTLCQKVEYHVDGTEKRLNLLRECIKPGTEIKFTMSIDSSVCDFSKEYIENAISTFADNYYNVFIKKFKNMDRPNDKSVWLGGGCGYVSKTFTYPMFKSDAVKITKKIFDNTRVPREHKHDKDLSLGVSPHILKLTQFRGKKYQFGQCELSITEI